MDSISRRQFLTRVAALAGAATGMSLLAACGGGPAPLAQTPEAVDTPTPSAAATSTVAPSATIAATATPAPPTSTPTPSSTPTPAPTSTPSPTPTVYTLDERRQADAAFSVAEYGEPDPAWQGKQLTVATFSGGERGGITGPYYLWKPYFEQLTGASYDVVEIPFADLLAKYTEDLKGPGTYDLLVVGEWFYGDLIAGGHLLPLDEYYEDPRMPVVDREAFPPSIRRKLTWGDSWYGVPNDSDGMVLYYRRDVLNDPAWQERYKAETGLDMAVPPRTWEQVLEMATFFNGKDWNGDGQPDRGIAMHVKAGGQALYHYAALSAPYVVLPGDRVERYRQIYWFDPETMEPVINSAGHVRALELMVELSKQGAENMLDWSLGEAWNDFLSGNAIFTFGWGDVAWLSQQSATSQVRTRLGVAALPGTLEVYNRESGQFGKPFDPEPNFVANAIGGSWHPVISKRSKNPDLAFYLAAFQATTAVNLFNIQRGWAGVDIGPSHSLMDPWGTADPQGYADAGWDPDDVANYSAAYGEMWRDYPTPLHSLRIPGVTRYWEALDAMVAEAIVGSRSAEDALDDAAFEWRRITEELGIEKQQQWYAESIGYAPA